MSDVLFKECPGLTHIHLLKRHAGGNSWRLGQSLLLPYELLLWAWICIILFGKLTAVRDLKPSANLTGVLT